VGVRQWRSADVLRWRGKVVTWSKVADSEVAAIPYLTLYFMRVGRVWREEGPEQICAPERSEIIALPSVLPSTVRFCD